MKIINNFNNMKNPLLITLGIGLTVVGFAIGFSLFYEPLIVPSPTIIYKTIIPEGYDSLEDFVIAKTNENLDLGAVSPAGLFTYRLSGSGISSSATSFTLTSLTLPQNDYPVQDADLSDTFYLTLEPGSTDRQEFVSCTAVGTNIGASVAISGCTRGLSPITPYTASTTLRFAHSGGAAVIFSNPPQLYNEFPARGDTEYITGAWGFQGTAPTSTICATANELCNKSYVDNSVNQGAATSTEVVGGIVELGTALETASSTDLGANIPLVLQTKNATDTPSALGCATGYTTVVGAGCTVIANLLGKLNQLWLDLTAAFTWTGLHTFNGGAIFNEATSTRMVIGSGNPTVNFTSGLYFDKATSTQSFHFTQLIDSANTVTTVIPVVASSTVTTNTLTSTSLASAKTVTIASGFVTKGNVLKITGGFRKTVGTNASLEATFQVNGALVPASPGCATEAATVGTAITGWVDIVFGSGNNATIYGHCSTSMDATPLANQNLVTSIATTTLKFSSEAWNIDFMMKTDALDTGALDGFSIIKF